MQTQTTFVGYQLTDSTFTSLSRLVMGNCTVWEIAALKKVQLWLTGEEIFIIFVVNKIGENMISVCAILLLLTASSPLLDVTDTMDRGGTAVYSVSLEDETIYWIILEAVHGQSNFDVITASCEMDFDHFMSLPYGEDFFYALEYAIVSGMGEGNESLTLPAGDSGLVYVIVHDAGGDGGLFSLKIH